MGCTSSTRRHPESQTDKATPGSPPSLSSVSDVPVIPLESPTSATRYHELTTKVSTPPIVRPARHRLRRRRRQEPHLDHHLLDRLEPLAQYLERSSKIDTHDAMFVLIHHAIEDLRDNILSFFRKYEAEKRTLWRLVQTGRVVQQVESFHRALDSLTVRCGLAVASPSGTSAALPRWQPRWRRMRAERLVFFRSYLEDHEGAAVSNSRIREPSDQLELLTLLKYDARKFDSLLTADELELLERAFSYAAGPGGSGMHIDSQMSTMFVPEWFVAPYDRTKQQLKWQRAAVTIRKAPRAMSSAECFELANTWSRLLHPHIMRLFGACHVGRKRFFVVGEGTPLNRCLKDEGFPLWRALHEAALALRFLHERRVGCNSISCADIVLFRGADRDTAMLAGFNLRQMKSVLELSGYLDRQQAQNEKLEDPLLEDDGSDDGYDVVDMVDQYHGAHPRKRTTREVTTDKDLKRGWQAPELANGLGPTEASDVYALGMCVVEAFSGGEIFSGGDRECSQGNALENYNFQNGVPRRPKSLTDDWQWALVERMCSTKAKDRPLLTEVLASFEVFAEGEEKESADLSSSKRKRKFIRTSLHHTQSRATTASIAYALSEVKAWCDEASEGSALNYQLYERMEDVAARLEPVQTTQITSDLHRLASLICRFRDMLQRHVYKNPLLRLAATRQVLETNKTLHEELDLLMDAVGLTRSGASIHAWSHQQEAFGEQLWHRMRVSLAVDSQTFAAELDGYEELSLLRALLVFETNKRNASYSVSDLELLEASLTNVEDACNAILPSSTSGRASDRLMGLPSWFIPPYEVVFNELDAFSRGEFGSVHFGKWLGLDVVVKKMLTPEEPGVVLPLRSRRGKSNAKRPPEDPHKRFLEEMSIWSELKHPNVLKLFGACHVGPCQFFLCEHASLGSIDTYVASTPGDQRPAHARRMLHGAALGLHYLHSKNIVHADLRCSNILVDSHGTVKLTNFGLSSMKSQVQKDGALTGIGGPYRWMAPECLNGSSTSFAANVYSFAMCAIEVVSGDLPWGREMSDAAIRSKVRKGAVPPRPANCFSDSEWELVERMCCRDPKQRVTINEVVGLLAGML